MKDKRNLWLICLGALLSVCTACGVHSASAEGSSAMSLQTSVTPAKDNEPQSDFELEESSSSLEEIVNHNSFVSSYGISYEEITEKTHGLLTGPQDRILQTWGELELLSYWGETLISRLDYAMMPLSRTKEDVTVVLYPDETICMGNSIIYTTTLDSNDYIMLYCNENRIDEAFAAKYDIGDTNNDFNGTSVWCGHGIIYHGPFDDPATRTEDLFVASFQYSGRYYGIVSYNLDETEFLRAINTIIT